MSFWLIVTAYTCFSAVALIILAAITYTAIEELRKRNR